ncbi:MAG: hypothetical protein ACRDN0_25135 [Trebonia sp.]
MRLGLAYPGDQVLVKYPEGTLQVGWILSVPSAMRPWAPGSGAA